MNQYLRKRIIIFYSSILLMLPVLNGLHFILIDHDFSKSETSKKYSNHKCDDFTLYQVYNLNHSNFDYSNPIEVRKFVYFNYLYQNNYVLELNVRIKNKGPPDWI